MIRDIPEDILPALLLDHTTRQNIIWATHDYEPLGKGYEFQSPILPPLITGTNEHVIQSRVNKSTAQQTDRKRDKAEVFTPAWICNTMLNLVDQQWFNAPSPFNTEDDNHTWTASTAPITFPEGKSWKDYVCDPRLEITCGEAPFIVSRYDAVTGQPIPIPQRIGILDRKLRVVGENTQNPTDWLKAAQAAFKSTYAYEWQGDNLLISRANVFLSFIDYFRHKFRRDPRIQSLRYIAYIISWNLFQMDGLKGVIPNSCGIKPSPQLNLFGDIETTTCIGCQTGNILRHNGTYALVRDWNARAPKGEGPGKKLRFIDLFRH